MKTFIKKRIMPWLLSAALVAGMTGAPVYAAETKPYAGGLCEHHREHTADCGYSEGGPCTHEHKVNGGGADGEDLLGGAEDCYREVEKCVHKHTAECYPEADDTDDEATPSNAKAAEPTECAHVCSEESGCVKNVLDCPHDKGRHDDSCGYSRGTPCGYVCEICANGDNPTGGNETEPGEPETAPQKPESRICICEELCTEDSINEDCPVCGAEGADLTECEGEQPDDALIRKITGWEWIDEQNSLTDGQLDLPGVTADDPVDFDTVVSLLPEKISAEIEGAEEPEEITLSGWACAEFEQDEEGNYPVFGEYTFTAKLPEGYILSRTKALRVTVTIGGEAGDFSTMSLVEQWKRLQQRSTFSSERILYIYNETQLAELAALVNSDEPEKEVFRHLSYQLNADIDLSGVDNWTPIGTYIIASGVARPFAGTFDGDGHKISNLKITTSEDYQGLFGFIKNGTVKNLGVEDADISVSGYGSYVGGVAGQVTGSSSSIENCYVTGSVTGGRNVGGVAGVVESNSSIENCYVAGSVTGRLYVGGLAGQTYMFSSIKNSYATGAVLGGSNAGGVVGSASMGATIENCYATGAVSGTQDCIGGVAGDNDRASITNCVALNPSVQGGNDTNRVVGKNVDSTISGNYAWDGMKVNGSTVTDGSTDNINGEALTYNSGNRTFNQSFNKIFESASGWNPLTDDALPTLADVPNAKDQSSEIPAYIQAGVSGDLLVITTKEELEDFRDEVNNRNNYSGKTVLLAADIDLSDVDNWTPIGSSSFPFSGTFDGGGHAIRNLTINAPYSEFQGLFGTIANSATVKNLGVENVDISGGSYVGGVASYVEKGKIENCYVTGVVSGGSCVGGVVGNTSSNSTVTNCYTTCTVSGDSQVGGVVGWGAGGSIENCYATGAVSGSFEVGGVVGRVAFGSIENCYAIGAVTSTSTIRGSVGGVAGWGASSSITNCVALNLSINGEKNLNLNRVVGEIADDNTLSGNYAWAGMKVNGSAVTDDNSDDLNGEALTYDSANGTFDKSFAEIFTDVSGWSNLENDALPILADVPNPELQSSTVPAYIQAEENSTLLISNLAELEAFRDSVNGGNTYEGKTVLLTADIDLPIVAMENWTSKDNWTPIGTYTGNSDDPNNRPFAGTFDGDGHKISKLTIIDYNTQLSYQGLFGYVTGDVKNLGVEDTDMRSIDSNVGGVTGYLTGGSIENCYVTGGVAGLNNVGGVAGSVNGGSIKNCHVTGKVGNIGESNIGGIAGTVSSGGSIENCYATSAVTSGNGSNVGGVAGSVSGNSVITDSYAAGAVSGKSNIGGVAGSLYGGSIEGSYATGKVVDGMEYVGGVVGINNSGHVKNCHAAGAVSGYNNIGGVVGQNSGSITNSYATGEVSGGSPAGGIAGYTSGGIINCYATGTVSGENFVGGVAGSVNSKGNIINSYVTGAVSGKRNIGGVAGWNYGSITNSVALNASVDGSTETNRVVGYNEGGTVSDCYAWANMGGNAGADASGVAELTGSEGRLYLKDGEVFLWATVFDGTVWTIPTEPTRLPQLTGVGPDVPTLPMTANESIAVITTHPTGSDTIYVYEKDTIPALTVKANAVGSPDAEMIYQWYVNTSDSNTGGTRIDGATSDSYTPPNNASGTRYYYATATSTAKPSRAAASKTAEVTVTYPLTAEVETDDASATKVYDGSASFRGVALKVTGGLQDSDTVTAAADGRSAAAGVGTHDFTAESVTLTPADGNSVYYSLAADAVSGAVTITKSASAASAAVISRENITYGESFTVTFTPTLPAANNRSRTATLPKTAELYLGGKLLATQEDIIENTKVTFTVNTSDKKIPASEFDGTAKTFTVQWGGDDNLNGSEGSVTAVLKKKALTGAKVNTKDPSASRAYNGTNAFTGVVLALEGAVEGDAVTAIADGETKDAGVGTGKAFTASNVTMGGIHKDYYYSLAPNQVGGTVTITKAASTTGTVAISSEKITYGESFKVTFTPALLAVQNRSRAATSTKTAELYLGEKLIATQKNITENTEVTFNVDTLDKNIPGAEFDGTKKTFTVQWGGDDNLNGSAGSTEAVLNKKALTGAEVNTEDSSASRAYNGTNAFTGVALTLTGIETGDEVTATADGETVDAGVGTGKTFTASKVTLGGAQKDYYSLAADKVSGTVTITKAASTTGTVLISSDTITYGERFTVTFTPALPAAKSRSRVAASLKTAELYLGGKLIAAQENITENTEVTFTVDTLDKEILGTQFDGTKKTFTVQWGGDDNLNESAGSVEAVLNKKALTGTAAPATEKIYNGTDIFTGVVLELSGVVSDDKVTAAADGAVTDGNVGKDKAFTAAKVTLDGDDKDYYSLAPGDVGGKAEIKAKDVTAAEQNDSRSVVVNSGKFADPLFDGVNSEKVTGTFVYSYDGATTHAAVEEKLKMLEKGAVASVGFTFTADGNYTGVITGTLTMKVVGLEFTTAGAVSHGAEPVYGETWGEILIYDPGKLSVTLDGAPVAGSYTFTVNGSPYDKAAVPNAGSYSYRLAFTAADHTFTDIEVLSGSISVAQREATLSWGDTTLTYNGSAQKPAAAISNKVDGDDVAASVTGEQTNAGDGYTAAVSELTGASAANYKLPAAAFTTFRILPAEPTGEVTISGNDANRNNKLDSGDTVTADISGIIPAGGTAVYQWRKTVGGVTADIGENADTYTLDRDDTRGKIFCVVTLNGNVIGTRESNRLDIAKEPLRGTIVISGNTAEGSVLTVSTPVNTGITPNDYTIAWFRDGAVITGAAGTSYTLTKADLGKRLKVIITAAESSEGFIGELSSNEIAIPATAPGKPDLQLTAGNGQVTASWEKVADNGSAVTGYTLTVKLGETEITGSPFAIDAGAASYTVTGLTNNEEYAFMLTAVNGIGGTSSDIRKATPKRTTNNSGSSGGGSSSGGGGGGSSSKAPAPAGTTTMDAKKGSVSSLTGIITGDGDGYSKWISETPQGQAEGTAARWKLQYADGTFASGTYVTDGQGTILRDAAGSPLEQPHWEMVNGAWYAFGTDSYAKSGMIFDPTLNGWFYVDLNSGMKTGWQLIDGKWYYFNPLSDGTKGKMAVSTTIDGYRIDENGVWVQ